MSLSKHLRDVEPFNQLPETVVQDLLAKSRINAYPAGASIFIQNDPPSGYLYVVKEGLVEITVLTSAGEDMVVDYLQEGQFLGDTALFGDEPYSVGARAAKEVKCYLLPFELLHQVERRYPQLRDYFAGVLVSRVRQLYSEMVADHTRSALGQMEAYPFKKRLSEIMSTPVVTCARGASARQVARHMAEKRISSVLVNEQDGMPAGLITEKDLVTKVVAADAVDPGQITAEELMTPHPHVMSPDTYMYEAMAYMLGHQIRHMPVLDRGEPVGMVTLRDLMRYRSQKAMLLLGSIEEEDRLSGLSRMRQEIVNVARALLTETRSIHEVTEIISYLHHAIIKRVYAICEQQMAVVGQQKPTVRHCFLIMGSGGRREMLLGPDQDNGFIYEDMSEEKLAEVENYFVPFAEKLVAALAEVGYPLCDGKVMANNPAWRGRLSDWRARLREWFNAPEPQNVRDSSIFFDFTTLVGDPSLAQELHGIVQQGIREFPGFLFHMMSLDLQCRAPIGFRGRFLLEKNGERAGMLSLKNGGSIFIVDCVRMFCLELERSELPTLERLKVLVELNVFDVETADHVRAAFEALVYLRLRNEIALVEAGLEPSHHLDPQALPKNEQELLRGALHAVKKLQDAARRHFAKTPF
ncbi:MAG: cyclic nucleotide-binding protein [Desulfuromonadales bacterium C00003096]|nr:MAG: cyclic nucleotide-binding protein [Desulfuromonadales bacterium C00003096]